MPEAPNSLSIKTDNRVESLASRGKNAAHIPDTPERQKLEKQRSVREIVFGAQDGVLTTLGIVSGVGGATADRATILITGGLSLLVGALSMGAGEFLGARAERDVVQNAIDFEQWEMATMPEAEFAEQVAYYRMKGFADDEAVMIVKRLEKNPEIWLHEMVRDEFGIDLREAESGGFRSTIAMAGSFAAGAALPVLPYALGLQMDAARWIGLALSVVTLFAIGFFAGKLGGREPVRKGLEIVIVGAVIFGVSWAAGHFIPALFGHAPVSVGG
jgi:vacuolar iron transporter family protein